MDKITLASFADLFINISAGWFGAAYAVLFLSESGLLLNMLLLTVDVSLGIVSLAFGIILRRRIIKK